MTKSLYTTADTKKVREYLLEEQSGYDALTSLVIPEGQAVLDHNHKTQHVRAVLHRQTNASLGKIENIWTRYLSYWYPGTLDGFLRQAAEYLCNPDDQRWYHPGWIKRVKADFNKLKASQQSSVLSTFGESGKNGAERKSAFNKVILTKQYGFDRIASVIELAKEQ